MHILLTIKDERWTAIVNREKEYLLLPIAECRASSIVAAIRAKHPTAKLQLDPDAFKNPYAVRSAALCTRLGFPLDDTALERIDNEMARPAVRCGKCRRERGFWNHKIKSYQCHHCEAIQNAEGVWYTLSRNARRD